MSEKTKVEKDKKGETSVNKKVEVKEAIVENKEDIPYLIIIGIIFLNVFLRSFRLNLPKESIGSEVGALKSITYYANSIFGLDEQPSLICLFLAGIAYMFGLETDFLNLVPDEIKTSNSAVWLRLLMVLFSSALIPLAYFTGIKTGLSKPSCILVSILLSFDNGLISLSRYFPLEAPATILSALVGLSWLNFLELKKKFDAKWYLYLSISSLSLGLSLCTSKHGKIDLLMSILMLLVSSDRMVSDRIHPMKSIIKHLSYKTFLFSIIPISTFLFFITVTVQLRSNHSQMASKWMSIEYQNTLKDSPYSETNQKLFYGSVIRLHHAEIPYGYISSSEQSYTGGSNQQMVYLQAKDDFRATFWIIEPGFDRERNYTIDPLYPPSNSTFSIEIKNDKSSGIRSFHPLKEVRHNDVIRLRHWNTRKYLHSHEVRAQFAANEDFINEVSCYGFDGFDGDDNDNFRIILKDLINVDMKYDPLPTSKLDPNNSTKEALEDENKQIKSIKESNLKKNPEISSFQSKFQLIHVNTNKALYSRPRLLDDWAKSDKNDETAFYEVIAVEPGILERSFFEITYNLPPVPTDKEGNKLGTEVENNIIKPDPCNWFCSIREYIDKMQRKSATNKLEKSSPISWLLLDSGITLYKSEKPTALVYFLTNPFIHLLSFLSIIVFILFNFMSHLYNIRYSVKKESGINPIDVYYNKSKLIMLIFSSQFIPWLFIEDKSLINYMPAYYWSILLLGHTLEYLSNINQTTKYNYKLSWSLVAILSVFAYSSFYLYSPYTYSSSNPGIKPWCNKLQLRSGWDLGCTTNYIDDEFYESYSYQIKSKDSEKESDRDIIAESQDKNEAIKSDNSDLSKDKASLENGDDDAVIVEHFETVFETVYAPETELEANHSEYVAPKPSEGKDHSKEEYIKTLVETVYYTENNTENDISGPSSSNTLENSPKLSVKDEPINKVEKNFDEPRLDNLPPPNKDKSTDKDTKINKKLKSPNLKIPEESTETLEENLEQGDKLKASEQKLADDEAVQSKDSNENPAEEEFEATTTTTLLETHYVYKTEYVEDTAAFPDIETQTVLETFTENLTVEHVEYVQAQVTETVVVYENSKDLKQNGLDEGKEKMKDI